MKVKVVYLDETREPNEINVGARAQIDFERKYDVPFVPDLWRSPRVEWIYYFSWAALFHAGIESETDFEKWALGVFDVLRVDEPAMNAEVKPARPTRRASRPAKSSNSASSRKSPTAS